MNIIYTHYTDSYEVMFYELSKIMYSSANYSEALDLLKTRYGHPQLVISPHMMKIMQIQKITKDCKIIRK